MDTTTSTFVDSQRATHIRAGRRIEYVSIGWTSLEGVVGIIAGLLAGSVALIGFGIDSIIEVASSAILLWRLSDHPHADEREKHAHRLVGIGFLALAAYISFDAFHDLIIHEPPRVSYFGIVYAGACIIVMPLLARAKRRAAAKLNSHALHADSHQSDICTCLSIILLVGLALNALFGWWWADPVAAFCMLPVIIKEGISGLRGESCSHHHAV
jgi:divalent metal cation (Fe/Co/Zn/Cd) transporter